MRRLVLMIFAVFMTGPCLFAIHLPRPRRHQGSRHAQYGLASWYGPGFGRQRTASGARFNRKKLTAAHRTLPLGTRVKVTNLRNGRSVVVKINDRGPVVRSRVIDLSQAAAKRIGLVQRGVAPVKITVLKTRGKHNGPERNQASFEMNPKPGLCAA
jgi:rare lipoprotein A